MKQNVFLLAIVIVLLGSCENEQNEPELKSFDYDQIGITHNKGLDFALNYYTSSELKAIISLENLDKVKELTVKSLEEFVKEEKIFSSPEISRSKFLKSYELVSRFSLLKSVNKKKLYPEEFEIFLTKKQVFYLGKISEIIQNLKLSERGINHEINELVKIDNEIKKECSEEEAALLRTTISVARYSISYWDRNYSKWITEIMKMGPNLKSTNVIFSTSTAESVIEADVAGAATGFIYGAYVGAVTGTVVMPGVGSLTGAIVGGLGDATVSAIISSSSAGLISGLKNWFD